MGPVQAVMANSEGIGLILARSEPRSESQVTLSDQAGCGSILHFDESPRPRLFWRKTQFTLVSSSLRCEAKKKQSAAPEQEWRRARGPSEGRALLYGHPDEWAGQNDPLPELRITMPSRPPCTATRTFAQREIPPATNCFRRVALG